MIRLVMERSGLTMWPVLSFVIFLVSCAVMLIWLYRPGSGDFYGNLARMALGEPGNGEAEGGRDGREG
ncbi:MAG: hypothetical protein JWP91_2591 [Fibrobacteres bacterium]|nr:hypothetical protein [Fibrobacterota bacterium]